MKSSKIISITTKRKTRRKRFKSRIMETIIGVRTDTEELITGTETTNTEIQDETGIEETETVREEEALVETIQKKTKTEGSQLTQKTTIRRVNELNII